MSKGIRLDALLLLSIVLLSGCSSNNEVNITQVTTQPKQEATETITWSSENNEVKLVPIIKTAHHEYEGVIVEVNGVKKQFDWDFVYEPQVFFTDVTTDGNKEAIIILNKGKGTGLIINEVHVLKSEDLSEIKVENYEDIVAKQIETNVTNSTFAERK